jgi:hypothetical protein
METINRLTLKALLMDTITFLKFGNHLAPNWKSAKNALCISAGQKTNISESQLLNLIGLVYKDNKIEAEFWATIDKYNAEKYL